MKLYFPKDCIVFMKVHFIAETGTDAASFCIVRSKANSVSLPKTGRSKASLPRSVSAPDSSRAVLRKAVADIKVRVAEIYAADGGHIKNERAWLALSVDARCGLPNRLCSLRGLTPLWNSMPQGPCAHPRHVSIFWRQ